MELNIRTYPDPILREKSMPITVFNEGVKKIATSMRNFIQRLNGIGLSAPQIGVSERIILADAGQKPIFIVNPEIVETKAEETFEEGCLSIPGTFIQIIRPSAITIKGYDLEGKEIQFKAKDLLARVIQHEVDHLDGRLIIDFLPKDELLRFHLEYNPNLPAYQVRERDI